jgi:hypothetical protein
MHLQITVDTAKSGSSQMTKACECCEKYLKHLDEKNQNMACFLRRMTGDFKLNIVCTFSYVFTVQYLSRVHVYFHLA